MRLYRGICVEQITPMHLSDGYEKNTNHLDVTTLEHIHPFFATLVNEYICFDINTLSMCGLQRHSYT